MNFPEDQRKDQGEPNPYACQVCNREDCWCVADDSVSQSLYPEPFGINEVLEQFKKTYGPSLLVRISPILEEGK